MQEPSVADRIAVISRDELRFSRACHSHPKAQLIYAIEGVVAVTTQHGTWVVPPSRAVWVPAGIEHETRSHAAVQFRALLIDAVHVQGLPATCAVVQVTPLLRELILRLAVLPEKPRETTYVQALTQLLLLELAFMPLEPLSLPRPRHTKLACFCDELCDAPDRSMSLEEAAASLHMSRSSFMRLFQRETGTSFAQWRQQARLLHALMLLAEGQSILNVALACGYDSPSAFSAMFRRLLGRSPTAYFSAQGVALETSAADGSAHD
ncbi:AraC family transcriptional regulator [Azospirillum endophyticum]